MLKAKDSNAEIKKNVPKSHMNVRPERTERIRMNVPLIITLGEEKDLRWITQRGAPPQLFHSCELLSRHRFFSHASRIGRTSEIYAGARGDRSRAAGTMLVLSSHRPCPGLCVATCHLPDSLAACRGDWRDEDPPMEVAVEI